MSVKLQIVISYVIAYLKQDIKVSCQSEISVTTHTILILTF